MRNLKLTHYRIPEDCFTTAEVALASGATLRQLQWWDERGYLKPWFGDIGHMRGYSADQVETARRMVELRRARVPLRAVKQLLAMPGWSTIAVMRNPLIIGGILLLPPPPDSDPYRKKPAVLERPKTTKRAVSGGWSDAELDAIAMRDQSVASGRQGARL